MGTLRGSGGRARIRYGSRPSQGRTGPFEGPHPLCRKRGVLDRQIGWRSGVTSPSAPRLLEDGAAPSPDHVALPSSQPTGCSSPASSSSEDGEALNGSFDGSYAGDAAWDEQGGPSGSSSTDLAADQTLQGGDSSFTRGGTVSGAICGQAADREGDATISA